MTAFKSPLPLVQLLEQRKSKGLFRVLKTEFPAIDFCSNDYLGLSNEGLLHHHLVRQEKDSSRSGSTGSRLITGNSTLAEDIEHQIAGFHHAEAALLFNSGYDANLGLMSSLPQKEDLVLSDELIHASLYDGLRMSYATHYKFRHNDLAHLRELLDRYRDKYKTIYVVVESVYSMDGDEAPLKALAALCREQELFLIVDEAHAIGVFGTQGRGLCEAHGVEADCFARVYTFGKAMGCHGAAVVGSPLLRDYLINFARSFIYTTALPEHSLLTIQGAYELLMSSNLQQELRANITHFCEGAAVLPGFIASRSAIHCLVVGSTEAAEQLEQALHEAGFYVKAIKSPTVKAGAERLRICLHAYNTNEQIDRLLAAIHGHSKTLS